MYFKVNKNNLNTLFITAAAELGGGNIASSTVIHELGHGMGLAHAPDNGNGSLQALSGAVVDDLRYTIMTAFVSEASSFGQAVSFTALDIATLQYLYGVDMTTHTAATIYSLTDPQTATLDVDGDGIADFQINLNGNYDFVAADFSL